MNRKGMTTRPCGIIRYPGGKSKLLKVINSRLQQMVADVGPDAEFREPFLGSGAVALAVLSQNPRVSRAWINDRDPGMAVLWQTVIHNPTSLKVFVEILPEAMRLFPENDYYKSDTEVLRSISELQHVRRHPTGLVAAMKLAVHQMSFSGLGTRAGGAVSNCLCRYNVDLLNAKIESFNEILSPVKLRHDTCTCFDFEEMFDSGAAFFYFDPPYVKAGPQLYQVAFTQADHERLVKRLRGENRPWLLSYDDHPLVHRLYGGWCSIEQVEVGCTINGCKRKKELLITNALR
jgi:DNA adenine methylase